MKYKKQHLIDEADKKHVTWSDSYSVGIKLIDDQHKGFLALVNELFNNPVEYYVDDEDAERARFKGAMKQTVSYVKHHFSTEENYMMATRFPGYADHKRIHDAFILTIIQTARDFDAGKRLMSEKLAYFLKDWVLSHVAVMDVQYARYFRSIATRKDCGRLTITIADLPLHRPDYNYINSGAFPVFYGP